MSLTSLAGYAEQYKEALLEDIIPFWVKHSVDWEYGGYFTCLQRNGKVYDTDKMSWLQARQVWTFSMLYNRVEPREQWRKIAKNGIHFLREHGTDKNGAFYFSSTREGQPLTHPFNIYSECFAALAFSEYAKITNDEADRYAARRAYQHFLDRQVDPKGRFEKSTGNRPVQSFGLPMMTAYLSRELGDLVAQEEQKALFEKCIHQIFEVHYNPGTRIIHEHVGPNGEFMDTHEGRLINPGHGIEAMWFSMDIAEALDRPELIETATDVCLQILEYSWDEAHGGIFYFMDAEGKPLQQLEWDQKLWWVHQEALIALSKAYFNTRRKDVWEWYQRVHNYTWKHFPDPKYGEWYGYLNRKGEPLLSLKGGKWKGCFHGPRAMYECWQNFAKITKEPS